jgi:hypothetical protein
MDRSVDRHGWNYAGFVVFEPAHIVDQKDLPLSISRDGDAEELGRSHGIGDCFRPARHIARRN